MTTELSRPIAVAKIGGSARAIRISATAEECAAVAARMGLPAIRSLECSFILTTEDDGVSVFAEGRLRAAVTQSCVVSAEEFDALVEDAFALRFVPAGTEREDPNPDLPDEIPYEAGTIDLGEAAAEQLGLVLDPYPRMDGATVLTIEDDEDASPFAILARRSGPDPTRH